MFQKVAITALVLYLTYAGMTFMVGKISDSLNQSANMVMASSHLAETGR